MSDILRDSYEVYKSNLKLVLLFSIPFVIAFIIPLVAPLPTYTTIGAIFLRTASVFTNNLNEFNIAMIILALFFSLLFISFAFVALSLIMKAQKTHSKISTRVMAGVEKYIGRVFSLFLLYLFAVVISSIVDYYLGWGQILTPILGFFGFMLIFYAPGAIVINERSITRSIQESLRLIVQQPQYFFIWIVSMVFTISIVDFVAIHALGTVAGSALVLLLNSLVILPYFVIMQIEAYMRKYKLLRR